MPGPTLAQALWFLPVAIPVGLWVAWNDMARMKIPNVAVYTLAFGFILLGPFALGWDAYFWRFGHLLTVLAVGIVLNAAGVFGAGDAKFAAAAAPFVAFSDLSLILYLFAACLLAGYAAHRIVKFSPLRRLVPDWESWTAGKRFPMGLPLGMTLITYLALPLLIG